MGLSDLGGAVSWGEAITLLAEYAADPGTHLGAKLAGYAYPASHLQLLSLVATIGNEKAAKKVMPWAMKSPGAGEAPTVDEVAQAAADLEGGIVFG